MQMYISEKEIMFIVVQAYENMQRMEREMREKNKLIKFDNYAQWYNIYEKFSKKIDFMFGDPTQPKNLLRELSVNDDKQINLVDEIKNGSK